MQVVLPGEGKFHIYVSQYRFNHFSLSVRTEREREKKTVKCVRLVDEICVADGEEWVERKWKLKKKIEITNRLGIYVCFCI